MLLAIHLIEVQAWLLECIYIGFFPPGGVTWFSYFPTLYSIKCHSQKSPIRGRGSLSVNLQDIGCPAWKTLISVIAPD